MPFLAFNDPAMSRKAGKSRKIEQTDDGDRKPILAADRSPGGKKHNDDDIIKVRLVLGSRCPI